MSTGPQASPRRLPDQPNLRHLKDQAKDLLKTGAATSITDAQFKIARLYGFASWPKLKAHVEAFDGAGLEKVQPFALRNAFQDVNQDDVGELFVREPVRNRRSDVSRAHHRHLFPHLPSR